jgi:hypothetical protein
LTPQPLGTTASINEQQPRLPTLLKQFKLVSPLSARNQPAFTTEKQSFDLLEVESPGAKRLKVASNEGTWLFQAPVKKLEFTQRAREFSDNNENPFI